MTRTAGKPRVAVCVSSRNRSHLLERLLRSLEAQTLPTSQFDVIVVNDGSVDDTAEMLARVSQSSSLRLQTIHRETSGGPAAGRNSAWRAATSDFIAFTDDDCVPVAGWLEAGLTALADRRQIVVGGVRPNPDQLELDGPFAHTWTIGRAEMRGFATANIFYRRADLDELGGFDERYPNPACEDTDLGLRAEEQGVAVEFCADALVWHDVRPDGVIGKIRDQSRWSDIPLIFREHPDARGAMLQHRVFWKQTHVDLLLLLAGVALTPVSRRALLATVPWIHRRLCPGHSDWSAPLRVSSLPGQLAVDLAELTAMVRGSIRHRSLVL